MKGTDCKLNPGPRSKRRGYSPLRHPYPPPLPNTSACSYEVRKEIARHVVRYTSTKHRIACERNYTSLKRIAKNERFYCQTDKWRGLRGFNPFSPNSDENEIFLHIINTCSNIQVMRIKKVWIR